MLKIKVNIELTDKDIKEIVCKHLDNFYFGYFDERNVKIYVKSKQNYRSEWEEADFKVIYNS